MTKTQKFIFILLLVLFLFTTFSFNCFATALPSYTFYLDEMNHGGSGSVSRANFSGKSCSHLTCTSTGSLILFTQIPSGLFSGQSYEFQFSIYRYSGSNADFYLGFTNKPSGDLEVTTANFFKCSLSDISAPSNWANVSCSQTYNGETYVCLVLKPTSLAQATNTFNVYFSQFKLFRFNPNEALESQNADIISQNDAEISQNEQLHDDLMNASETYTITEYDFSNDQLEVDNFIDNLFDSLISFSANTHLSNGLQCFTLLFTSLFDGFESDDHMNWVSGLIYFNLGLAVLLAIVSHYSLKLGDSDDHTEKKSKESKSSNSSNRNKKGG